MIENYKTLRCKSYLLALEPGKVEQVPAYVNRQSLAVQATRLKVAGIGIWHMFTDIDKLMITRIK